VSDTPHDDHDNDRHQQEMRLRPTRPAVTRLSRNVLLGLGVTAAVGISGALFFALSPHRQTAKSELYNTNNRSTPDGLATLPHDYTGLPRNPPQLGPPLPGDLGRPILNAGAPAPGMPSSTANSAQQHIAEEQEAARTSHLFATTNLPQELGASLAGGTASGAASPSATSQAASKDLSSQDHKLAFLTADVDHRTVSPERVRAPASPYIVQAGSVIAAALITGLRSDLPGQVTAQVTEDVYDSPTGKIMLIPQGARLIGEYDAQIAFGQTRALLVWNRLILPGGRSIVLERQPAADSAGYAGIEDEVDNHWGMLFEAATLSTVLSVGSMAGTSGNTNSTSLAQALQQGASQSVSQTGEQVVSRSLSVQPTITIRPGFPVRVMVTHDLVFR